MIQYIDKSALVAEIEKCYNECLKRAKITDPDYWNAKADAYRNVLTILNDTLEVKGVDLEKEYEDYVVDDPIFGNFITNDTMGMKLAKHFFELGLKAKDWEKERMEECPYRQVGCTMYEGHILECKGACSWVVDYPKLKKLKAQKGESYESK